MDIGTSLGEAARSIEALFPLLGTISYIIGIIYGIKAVVMMARNGSGHGRQNGGGAIAVTWIIATIFIAAPEAMAVGRATLLGVQGDQHASYQDLVGYVRASNSALNETAINSIAAYLLWIKFLGWIAFLRGAALAHRASVSTGGEVTQGRAAVFMIAGVLAANITPVVDMLNKTFGVDLVRVATSP